MYNHSTTSGVAALTICEALLLALNDAKVLPESEIMGVLKDAAATGIAKLFGRYEQVKLIL